MTPSNIANQAVLLLEDGTTFYGKPIGKIGTTTGEICFNTGLTGYQEVFTDPSYYGQVVIMTNNHIGNYGTNFEETESDGIKISGLIVKEFTENPSRKSSQLSLNDYLIDNLKVGISEIDTRALVRHIRSKGAMNCIISSENLDTIALKNQLENTPSMEGLSLVENVSTPSSYTFGSDQASYKIALMDYGLKTNIARCLSERDTYIKVFPHSTKFQEIKEWGAQGIMLSNGPGDPSAMPYEVAEIQKMLENNLPIFGICLGNQLLGKAMGMKTYKMHHGHRGLNHPVKNLVSGRSEITSQNHGFSLEMSENDKALIDVTHINLNDQTIEGIKIKGKNAFAVQYHPESSPGPHDSRYLFDEFITNIKNNNR